jgi:hypothetical protein
MRWFKSLLNCEKPIEDGDLRMLGDLSLKPCLSFPLPAYPGNIMRNAGGCKRLNRYPSERIKVQLVRENYVAVTTSDSWFALQGLALVYTQIFALLGSSSENTTGCIFPAKKEQAS